MRKLLISVFLSLSLSLHAAEIVPKQECAADPQMSYAYYLPGAYTAERRWPVLFIFDPRQRGPFAAELFKDVAEEYGWVLVSSNDTRSDDPDAPNARALNCMFPDVLSRFAVDRKRVYATGFSGGAILAWELASSPKTDIVGVIAVGGRVYDPSKITAVSFDWFGVAGEYDFNLAEMKMIDERLTVLGTPHRLETFEGPHRWAPKDELRRGVDWMELQAMKHGTRPRDEALIRTLYDRDLEFAAAGRDDLERKRRYEATVRTFDSLIDTDEPGRRAAALAESAKLLLADERRADKLEARHRARMPSILNRFLQAEDMGDAADIVRELEIDSLKKIGKAETYTGRAARRVLETIFVQVNFYLPPQVSGPKAVLLKRAAEAIREK